MTDQPAEVTGSAHNRAGPPDASVMLFPTDQTRWRDARAGTRTFRTARVSKAGAFSLSPVLPGDYFIAAGSDEATAVFPDVRLLTALAAVAKTIHVNAADKQILTLTTAEVAPPKTPVPVPGEQPLGEPAAHIGPFSAPPALAVVISRASIDQSAQKHTVSSHRPGHASSDAPCDRHGQRRQNHRIASGRNRRRGRFVFLDLPVGRYR